MGDRRFADGTIRTLVGDRRFDDDTNALRICWRRNQVRASTALSSIFLKNTWLPQPSRGVH